MDDTAVPSQAVVAAWQKSPLLVAMYYSRSESVVLGTLRLLNAESRGRTEVRQELMCQFVLRPRPSGLPDKVDLLTPQVERNPGMRPAAHGARYVILPVRLPGSTSRVRTRRAAFKCD
jgi:hypothetical protein